MNCPHCQRPLPDPSVATCPFCGMPVNAPAGQDPYTDPTVMQGAPGGDPARPAWNQPLPEQPAYTPPLPSSYAPPGYEPMPNPAYGQPPTPSPAYGQPPTPTSPYGQPPVYGQPEQPGYGTTQGMPGMPPGYQPNYQTGYPGAPMQPAAQPVAQPWAGQQPQAPPQKKSRAGCVIGCLVALLLVAGLLGGGYAFLQNQPGGLVLGGVTVGGSGSLTAPGGGTIIYQDALNGSTKADWTDDSNCFFGSGGYHINAGFICYAPTDKTGKVGDAVTTVSASQISGPITYAYGLVIRRASKGNYYEFLVDANGKWLFDKVVNGTNSDIVKFTPNAAIKKGLNQSNTLSVKAQGGHFVFSVNGTQVGTADDTTFTTGDVGLSGNDGIEVVYTNLTIAHVKN